MPASSLKEATRKPKSSTSKTSTLKLEQVDVPKKRLKPLTSALSNPPKLAIIPSQSIPSKGNAKFMTGAMTQANGLHSEKHDLLIGTDGRLWVDKYEPTEEADLAVHKKKVEDVRRWFTEALEGGPAGKLKKYRRILALTGPAGTAKTTTVRILSREMGFEILEWRNSMDENFAGDDYERESLTEKFQSFLTRASSCHPIFSSSTPTSSSSSSSQRAPKSQIILLEDLPNILHPPTQTSFHGALQSFIHTPPSVPLVVIVSDAGTRGEASDERMAEGNYGCVGRDVVDVRTVFPSSLLNSPYVTQIGFNPIAPTLLRRALQALMTTHFSQYPPSAANQQPAKEMLDVIIESSNGDIRSAVMALEFACVVRIPADKKGKKRVTGGGGARAVLEAVTRREQSLALFHLMGKVLYNKRKNDPPNPSASAKDIEREKAADALIRNPPPLPPHHHAHTRRASRVDVDTLYADSPVDSSLFSLYIQQNYPQFCNEVEECENVSEWLSWIDSSGGELWHQANPHRFHLLTLGTLHSLPSPVVRRSQKFFKPEFFDVLKRTREAEDAVTDTREWLQDVGVSDGCAGSWSKDDVAVGVGSVLKSRDAVSQNIGSPHPTHRLFSRLVFVHGTLANQTLAEDDTFVEDDAMRDHDTRFLSQTRRRGMDAEDEREGDGLLEDDDIIEF